VDWSAHLAAGNWRDVPAWRSYFGWQETYGSPEDWEQWYQKNAYFSGPLYPYGLAALRLMFGSPVWPARILQLLLACLASSVIALAVFGFGEDLLRRGREEGGARGLAAAAILAGLLYGLYGPLVFHDGFLLRDGPVAHLSTLLLAWPLIARGRPEEKEEKREISSNEEERAAAQGGRSALFLGLLGGVAILLKQTTAPLALASLYLLSKKFSGGAKRRRIALMGALGLALPLSVLCIRNISAGVPPLTFDTRQALGLVWGNGEGASASTSPPASMGRILTEARGSTLRTARVVLEGYKDAPLDLPKLLLRKFATFFNAYEAPDNASFYFFRDRLRILRWLPVFSCLLGAGLVGLIAARMLGVLRKGEFALAVVAILTPLAACLLVFTNSRYRAAIAGPLALGAGLFILITLKALRQRRLRELGLLAVAAGALSLVPLLPSVIPAGRHRFSDAMVYATLLEGQGDRAEAAREVQRYLEEGADDSLRNAGIVSLRHWYETGNRDGANIAPEGLAPPERRLNLLQRR
jgi:hypothetical protein